MLNEVKFSNARQSLTALIDNVQRLEPFVIQPRKQSELKSFVLNEKIIELLVSQYKFEFEVLPEDDGSVTLSLDKLELYANADNKDNALWILVEDLIDYAKIYQNNMNLYFNDPNRKEHYPYLFRILLCNTSEEVYNLILTDNAKV